MIVGYDIGDSKRCQVLQTALNKRQGSVVWQCIRALETPLLVPEREEMFKFAFDHDVWQVLKALVEVKDCTGVAHRDVAFLEALDQGLWDMVDFCQLHHSDINVKDDRAETPLHRAARARNWEAVEEIVSRDGDPNMLDRDGCSVLNRALSEYGTIAVKALIEYHADIHQPAQTSGAPDTSSRHYALHIPSRGVFQQPEGDQTPIQLLISEHYGDFINHTLM
jgi:ankyrin repeat protein